MKLGLQSALIIHFLVIYSTVSRGMEIKFENFTTGLNLQKTETPPKSFENRFLSSILMNGHTTDVFKGTNERIPIDEEDYIVDYSTDQTEDDVNRVLNEELTPDVKDKSTNSTVDAIDASETYYPSVFHIRPKPKTISVNVKEFHECVSCHADDGARSYYKECLKELTFKNLEIMKSCCHLSFDSTFCTSASTGKIDYNAICQDPSKALKADYCFWMNVHDKEADDINKYRDCKKIISDRYCTTKSSSDVDMKIDEV